MTSLYCQGTERKVYTSGCHDRSISKLRPAVVAAEYSVLMSVELSASLHNRLGQAA